MKDRNPTPKVRFRLVEIRTEEFATFQENQLESNSFEIKYGGEIKINAPDYTVGVFTSFIFEQQGKPVLKLANSCHFQIHKDYWNSQIKDDKLILSKDLGTHFLVLSVGTARGIIHSKKPLWLQEILLPTIDVSKLIKKDMIFSLAKDEEE